MSSSSHRFKERIFDHDMFRSVGNDAIDHMQEIAEAMKDGKIDKGEARKCRKELVEMMAVAAQLKAYLEQLI